MTLRGCLAIACIALCVCIQGCGDVPVRPQSRYFLTDQIGIVATADNGYFYTIQLRSIRDLPELGRIRFIFSRPGLPDWSTERIITAGKRRYSVTTPRFPNYSDDGSYGIRIVLIADDNVTLLDRLSHRFRVTAPQSVDSH